MDDAYGLAEQLVRACVTHSVMLATVESCTGGLIAGAVTAVPGSSAALDRGFVTYSNEAKVDLVGVNTGTLSTFGAVSEQVALEMAAGGLARSRAGLALSVTGIAGPDGGSAEKPVGLVWFAVACAWMPPSAERRLFGDIGRAGIRQASVAAALQLGLDALGRRPERTRS